MKGKCRRKENKFGRESTPSRVRAWAVTRVDKWELMGRDSGSVVCGVNDGMERSGKYTF